jgi:ribokinase
VQSSPFSAAGPEPRRVADLDSLARELTLLASRAARGTGVRRVSNAELARRLHLPVTSKSTMHSYMSGKSFPPADVLDAIVIALGATAEEQRLWSQAWERVNMRRVDERRRGVTSAVRTASDGAIAEIRSRLLRTRERPRDVIAVTAHNVDTLIRVPKIIRDDETEIPCPIIAPGGSGANTVAGLGRIGVKVSVVGAVADDDTGRALRTALDADGVDTHYLLKVSRPGEETGVAFVVTEHGGARTIYPHAGINNYLAEVIAESGLLPGIRASIADHRILHLSSFVGSNERSLQQQLATSLDADTILSFTPGSLYAKQGGDRLAPILQRTNVLFVYEQQLELLLLRTNLGDAVLGPRMEDRMRLLFSWRAASGSREPLVLVVKRPAELIAGARSEYVAIAHGRTSMEEFIQPDAELSQHDIVDATGAGDALAGGVLFALLCGASISDLANVGYVMALSASGQVGARAGLPGLTALVERWRALLPSARVPDWLTLQETEFRKSMV